MIKKWHNTVIEQAASMMDVTDDMIHEWSDGEVTVAETGEKNGMSDPGIFGELKEESFRMGHVELPVPVVNINYVRTMPVLHILLGMSFDGLDGLIYYGKCLVTDAGEGTLACGAVVDRKEMEEVIHALAEKNEKAGEENPEGKAAKLPTFLSGAEAVEYLLKEKKIPDVEKYILHTMPVLPLQCRYCMEDGELRSYGLNILSRRIVNRSGRLRKLMGIKAPDIILVNEARMLQETVDSYISNGARGIPILYGDGRMIESCRELYLMTHEVNCKQKVTVQEEITDILCKEIPGIGKDKEQGLAKEIVKTVRELYAFRYLDDEDDQTEETVVSEEDAASEFEKEEELMDAVTDAFRPVTVRIAQELYSSYEDFHDAMTACAGQTVLKAVVNYEEGKKEQNRRLFVNAIRTGLEVFVKKEVMLQGLRDKEEKA